MHEGAPKSDTENEGKNKNEAPPCSIGNPRSYHELVYDKHLGVYVCKRGCGAMYPLVNLV